MSYEKMYSRQFISLPNNKIIPVVLSGANNCTVYRNGKEVYERYWNIFCNKLVFDGNNVEEEFGHMVDMSSSDDEWFKQGSKWVKSKDIIRWIKSGVKSARPIEDIVRALGHSIKCKISISDNSIPYGEPGHEKDEILEYIKTTEQLSSWVERAIEFDKNKKPQEKVYFCIDYMSWEPLGLGRNTKPVQGPVVCSVKKGFYLNDYGENEYGYSRDFEKAIVFDSIEDFNNKVLSVCNMLNKYRLISAERPYKNYVIRITSGFYAGMFVIGKTSKRVKLSRYSGDAKRFLTLNAANTYINKTIRGTAPSCETFEPMYLEESEYITV